MSICWISSWAPTLLSLSQDIPITLPIATVYKDVETLNSPSAGMGKAAAHWKMQGIWKECPEAVMCPSDQLADCILFSHSFIPSRHPWFLFQPWVVMTSSSGTTTGEGEWGPSQATGTMRCFYWPEEMMDEQQMLLSASPCRSACRDYWYSSAVEEPWGQYGSQIQNIGALRRQSALSPMHRMLVSSHHLKTNAKHIPQKLHAQKSSWIKITDLFIPGSLRGLSTVGCCLFLIPLPPHHFTLVPDLVTVEFLRHTRRVLQTPVCGTLSTGSCRPNSRMLGQTLSILPTFLSGTKVDLLIASLHTHVWHTCGTRP